MQKKEDNNVGGSAMVQKLFEAGAHYGYSKARRHPSTAPFIYGTKNKIDIIDLERTEESLEKVKEFVKELALSGKILLFVGTKAEARKTILKNAESANAPYVIERWVGGTLSNFGEIKKRINELENYQKDSESGELNKYTKKERVVLAKEMEKLSRYFEGLVGLRKVPDAIFLVDSKKENIARLEANKNKVPVIALCNTDTNIKNVDYPIITNDASIPAIKIFVEEIAKTYKDNYNAKESK